MTYIHITIYTYDYICIYMNQGNEISVILIHTNINIKSNKIGIHRKLLRETQYQNQCTSNHISGLKDWVSL